MVQVLHGAMMNVVLSGMPQVVPCACVHTCSAMVHAGAYQWHQCAPAHRQPCVHCGVGMVSVVKVASAMHLLSTMVQVLHGAMMNQES